MIKIKLINLINLIRNCSFNVELSESTMEPFVFEYSDKNIPVHDERTYRKMFINAVETFDKNLRWAAFFFLNPDKVPEHKNWYNFKSNNPAPQVLELKPFQDAMMKLTQNLEISNLDTAMMSL